jgi:hypothetical protein
MTRARIQCVLQPLQRPGFLLFPGDGYENGVVARDSSYYFCDRRGVDPNRSG